MYDYITSLACTDVEKSVSKANIPLDLARAETNQVFLIVRVTTRSFIYHLLRVVFFVSNSTATIVAAILYKSR